jgi:hypothetical protein
LKAIDDYGCPVMVRQDALPAPDRIVYDRTASDIVEYHNDGGRSKWVSGGADAIDGKVNLVFELDGREFYPPIDPGDVRKMLKAHADIDVGAVIGVPKSNFKKYLKYNGDFTSYRDVFSSEFFDADALRKRINAFHDASPHDIEHFINEVRRIKTRLRHHPKVPNVIQTLYDLVQDAVDIQHANLAASRLLLSTGPTVAEASFLLRILEEPVPEDRFKPSKSPVLDAAYAAALKSYPKLLDHYSDRDGEAAVIYVMGCDALRASQAVSFYDTEEFIDN